MLVMLIGVDPQAAHRVMHAGKDLHRDIARVVADKLLIDLKNAFELAVQCGAVDVRQVEIDHRLAVKAQTVLVDDLVNGACGDVARDEVAVLGIPLFQKVKALSLWNLLEGRLSPALRGTQTRPPSPRADSDISRSLSSPGMQVGCT
jgi:hypothetical protein